MADETKIMIERREEQLSEDRAHLKDLQDAIVSCESAIKQLSGVGWTREFIDGYELAVNRVKSDISRVK